MNKIYLKISKLSKSFKSKQILKDVNLDVNTNECTVLIGKNGAGKTTLLEIIYKFSKIDSGYVEFLGNKKYKMNKIGIVPQQNFFDEDLNVFDNLRFHLLAYGYLSKKNLHHKIDEKLNLIGCYDLKNRSIDSLSGGEKRKIALVRALLNDPLLLLLDEPTEGIDMESKLLFWNNIKHLKENGMGVLLTTHHYDEMQKLADNVYFLKDGITEFFGDMNNLSNENLEKYFLEEIDECI